MAFTTRYTVLERIREGDDIGWREFAEIYRPLILLRGSDRGLAAQEKEELFQDVLVNIFQGDSVFKFQRNKGRFRDYLKTIIDRRAIDILRKRRTRESSWQEMQDEGAQFPSDEYEKIEEHWDQAWYKHLLAQAMETVQQQVAPATFLAFQMVVVDGMEAQQVATQLNVKVSVVYNAKHRILERLNLAVKALESVM